MHVLINIVDHFVFRFDAWQPLIKLFILTPFLFFTFILIGRIDGQVQGAIQTSIHTVFLAVPWPWVYSFIQVLVLFPFSVDYFSRFIVNIGVILPFFIRVIIFILSFQGIVADDLDRLLSQFFVQFFYRWERLHQKLLGSGPHDVWVHLGQFYHFVRVFNFLVDRVELLFRSLTGVVVRVEFGKAGVEHFQGVFDIVYEFIGLYTFGFVFQKLLAVKLVGFGLFTSRKDWFMLFKLILPVMVDFDISIWIFLRFFGENKLKFFGILRKK